VPWLMLVLRSKVFIWVAMGLLAIGAVFLVVKYIEGNAVKELKIERKLKEIDIQERTKDATDSAPDNVNDALEYLRNR